MEQEGEEQEVEELEELEAREAEEQEGEEQEAEKQENSGSRQALLPPQMLITIFAPSPKEFQHEKSSESLVVQNPRSNLIPTKSILSSLKGRHLSY